MAIPIYQAHGCQYEADTCRPLIRAARAGAVRHVSFARGHYPGRRLPRAALPGLKAVGFWDARCRQDWGLDWHRNEGIELTLVERGTLGFSVDDQEFTLQPGDLTFTHPWQQHRVGNPEVAAGRLHFLILDLGVRRPHQSWRWPAWIVLTPQDRRELTDILRHNDQPVWRATPDVLRCFRRVGAAVESDRGGSELSSLAVQLNELLLLILEMSRNRDLRLDRSLSSALRTVELFWADLQQNPDQMALEWTVRGMARRCGMGVTSFTDHSKQLTNVTPMQHLNQCRLAAAARALVDHPELTVTDVALGSGFASSQYFATLFRSRFGVTPRDFRASRQGPDRDGHPLPRA
ncbi:MAG: AraC family transcriptional regulator [Planctomycetaceae bacterium]|nr:AraC family transcriptional regulator [Planctomycetaceae bacterium]